MESLQNNLEKIITAMLTFVNNNNLLIRAGR